MKEETVLIDKRYNICGECGTKFEPPEDNPGQNYCSQDCWDKRWLKDKK